MARSPEGLKQQLALQKAVPASRGHAWKQMDRMPLVVPLANGQMIESLGLQRQCDLLSSWKTRV
jgi:hypothetical protein